MVLWAEHRSDKILFFYRQFLLIFVVPPMQWLTGNISIYRWKIPVAAILWFVLAGLAAIAEISRGPSAINNYSIFTGVFQHTLDRQNLYVPYPAEYIDTNHYGPLFSLLIAPFAMLPVALGCFLWCMVNAWVLLYAVRQLPISAAQKNIILLIGLVEMMTAIHNVQFNPMLTGWIVLAFVLTDRNRLIWATLFIAAGFLVKIYGIAGIAFFWFSRNKLQFALSFVGWLIVLFCLPMIISSPEFIMQSYRDWLGSIMEKNALNIQTGDNIMQDISVMGMIRRIGHVTVSNTWVLLPAAIVHALPFLRVKQYKAFSFRATYLCFALIGIVIFSSSAESSTFVMAVTGVGIWYAIQDTPVKKTTHLLLGFVILLTSLSATDIFPPYIRDHFIRPYSLKALPCFIAWCVIGYQLLVKNFAGNRNSDETLANNQYFVRS